MKRISGLVLVKETGIGIPNLLVAAYDCEADTDSARKPLSREPGDLLRYSGRLGSVLTDSKGQFCLNAEDLTFPGNDERPDLRIAVFAAEDVQGVDNPMSLPPEEGLLYISSVSRSDAGAEEAYVIRLLQAQLDKFDISVSATPEGVSSEGAQYVRGALRTWAFRDGVKEGLKKRRQAETDKAAERRKSAQEFVSGLSGIPLHLRNDPKTGTNPLRNNAFLIESKSDLVTKLADTQTNAVKDGLQRLRNAPVKPRVRLHLTTADLRKLGLKAEQGKIVGSVQAPDLADFVRAQMKGADLKKVRGLDNPTPEQLIRRYLSPAGGAQAVAPQKEDTTIHRGKPKNKGD